MLLLGFDRLASHGAEGNRRVGETAVALMRHTGLSTGGLVEENEMVRFRSRKRVSGGDVQVSRYELLQAELKGGILCKRWRARRTRNEQFFNHVGSS